MNNKEKKGVVNSEKYIYKINMNFITIFDYLIILIIIGIIYKMIRKTESVKLMVGVVIVYGSYFLAEKIGLKNTAHLLNQASIFFTIAIVMIFQPELRMLLRKVGTFTKAKVSGDEQVINEVEEAVFTLSKKKIGALIIFDPENSLTTQFDNATPIDAEVTNELLQTIFYPNTRLHDGAVIIQNDKITYAGCKLQINGLKADEYKNLGTRHLAAIENAEQYGIVAVVVSEETGNVSVATENGLTRIKSGDMFKSFFSPNKDKKSWLRDFFKKK